MISLLVRAMPLAAHPSTPFPELLKTRYTRSRNPVNQKNHYSLKKNTLNWSVTLRLAGVLSTWREWTKKTPPFMLPLWSGAVERWGKEKRVTKQVVILHP
jgi:hypothetical protein